MDPKANIAEQVEIARELQKGYGGDAASVLAERLAELVLALDEWRRKGGFDPYTEHFDPLDPYTND